MSDEKKSSARKNNSVFQRVKKTLRQRSRESNQSKRKSTSKASERSKKDFPRFLKGKIGNRKKSSDRTKSICSRGSRTNSKDCNTSRSSHSREAESRSRVELIPRSIDLEEDVDHLVGTPDLLYEIKKEETKEFDEKKDVEVKDKKEEKKIERKEEKKEEKKEDKKDGSKEDFKTKARKKSDEKVDFSKIEKPKTRSWLGMEPAMRFFHKHNDILKIREEYNFLDSLTYNKTTDAFDANKQRNRHGCPKIYDENRVKLNRPGHEDVNYINASYINLKSFSHKLVVAQLPQFENESFVEDFWQMIYQEQITLIYLLVPEKALKNTPTSLFKEEHGAYQYVGKMFINNRRAEVSGDPKEYTIEVLLEGNSDSVICQLNHHATWEHLQQAPKTRPIIKMIHQFLTEKQIQNANVCVVSVFGCGRACSFIGALYAISQLNHGIEPSICEIMKDIKQHRPSATESFAQYAGIYAIVLDYIARKRGSKRDPINKEINDFIDILTDISPAVSPTKEKSLH